MESNLLIGNDQVLELVGLREEIANEYIEDATVTATIRKANGQPVDGENWPITLVFVAVNDDLEGRSGLYQGLLEDGIELVAGRTYSVEITAEVSSDLVGFWKFPVVAKYRGI